MSRLRHGGPVFRHGCFPHGHGGSSSAATTTLVPVVPTYVLTLQSTNPASDVAVAVSPVSSVASVSTLGTVPYRAPL